MFEVVIEFDGFIVKGWADLCGPYAEIEGSEVTSVTRRVNGVEHLGIMHQDFLGRALCAVETAAYEKHIERHGAYRDPDMDYDDHHQVGPDYWHDPESGEPRCG